MGTIIFQVVGVFAFFAGTIVLRRLINRDPTAENAEILSRWSHALFWGGLVLPAFAGMFSPGLTRFDAILGVPPLPQTWLLTLPGWLLLGSGGYLLAASNLALKGQGSGYAAFKLTHHVVARNIYEYVRNPMSLGTYCLYLGISLLSGSTYLFIAALCVVIPAHIFNLVYFEEIELALRHGETYTSYMRRVPRLIPVQRPWNRREPAPRQTE